MRRRGLVLAAAALAAVALLLLVAVQHGPAAEISVERDLTYAKVGDTELKLDLAMPKAGSGPFPAVVFLHGEGWRAGKRQQMNHFIEGMARLGYVGVSVDYRLVPAARFPAPVEDCKAAVRWLRAHAAQYRIRADRIGAVGFSAGGHLASMLGVVRKEDGLEGTGGNAGQSSRVQAVVSFFGPTDFSTRDWPRDLETEVIAPFLGGSFAERPDAYRKASPISYASAEAPPFLFFHGSDDALVPVDQSRRLAAKLKVLGVAATLVELQGEGHGFSDSGNQKSMQQMLDFLGEQLKKSASRISRSGAPSQPRSAPRRSAWPRLTPRRLRRACAVPEGVAQPSHIGRGEMTRAILIWLPAILLAGCAGGVKLEGMSSESSDDAYWARQREECFRITDDIAQKKCLDKVADARRHGLVGK